MTIPDELTQLFDRAPIAVFRSTQDGRFTYANAAFVRLLGYASAAEVYALDIPRDVYFVPPERARMIAMARPHEMIESLHLRWKRRDGAPLEVVVTGRVLVDADGMALEAVAFDATPLISTASQLASKSADLERTTAILDLVLRQMPAFYWVVDRDLRILRTGGAVLEVLGYPLERNIGRTLYETHAEEPGNADTIAIHLRAIAGETVTYANEYRNKLLDNTIGPYYVDGVIVGAIGTGVDVTGSRRLERRMVDAQRAESLGVLAGGLAHDFNNLLVAMLGNAELALRDIPVGAPGREAIENVRDASLRAAELTGQLMTYAGRGVGGTAPVTVAPLVDELLRITGPTLPDRVRAQVEIPRELEVRGDPSQVRQALLNLIGNARDALATRGGAIDIRARAIRHDGAHDPDDALTAPAGAYIALEVSDDGPGIDVETRRRIFEPFFTTKSTGHGLGLAAVLGIVRAHGGGIRVRSQPGLGSSFEVMWPAAGAVPAAPIDLAASSAQPIRTARSVLIIDDEDLVRDVVARMLEDLGYAAITAADGREALALLAQHRVDAVLVDMTMPTMTGADVVAALRVRYPELPIIVCSGYDRREQISADAYLAKPFHLETLGALLDDLLRRQPS